MPNNTIFSKDFILVAIGRIVSAFGLMPILYISIGYFCASVILDVFIHIPFEKRVANGNIFTTDINDLKESFHFMFKTQAVLWKISVIFGASNLFLTSLILIGLPVIITQRLDFAADTANRDIGYAQGVFAAGAILGGFLAGALVGKVISCFMCVVMCRMLL